MSRKHTKALVEKTREIPAFAVKTFVTVAQDPDNPTARVSAPYIVWHPSNGTNTQEAITGPRASKHPRFTGHIVGQSADQVQLLVDLLEEKLLPGGRGVVLPVEGEKSFPLWFRSPLPVQVQTDPQPTVVYGVVECGWRSDPT